jgi:glycerol-3-phosphate O-acyltransferase / dihydroxyacetone phosphate acyltransferase
MYLKPRHLYWRLIVRTLHTLVLGLLALPGLILLTPIFIVAKRQAYYTAHSGPTVDVYDEVAQTKLLYGLLSAIVVYFIALIYSWYSWEKVIFTAFGVPLLMWFTLRWIEDILSAARSARSIVRMLVVGKKRLDELREIRDGLYVRVADVAVGRLGLPRDAKELIKTDGLRRRLGYFSVKRRRKKDWNEVLRTYDVTDYVE